MLLAADSMLTVPLLWFYYCSVDWKWMQFECSSMMMTIWGNQMITFSLETFSVQLFLLITFLCLNWANDLNSSESMVHLAESQYYDMCHPNMKADRTMVMPVNQISASILNPTNYLALHHEMNTKWIHRVSIEKMLEIFAIKILLNVLLIIAYSASSWRSFWWW